jgi:hypothetical protein
MDLLRETGKSETVVIVLSVTVTTHHQINILILETVQY